MEAVLRYYILGELTKCISDPEGSQAVPARPSG
jgi:hypothetical protein